MRLGEIIKRYREENGLSLRDFAKKSGVSNSYLSMLETGRQPQSGRPIVPTLTTLNKIASAVGMRIDDLIAAVDDMPVSVNEEAGAPAAVINGRLKERRLQMGLTLLDVADAIGVKEATVQRYESGAIKNIGHETICKLSDVLHCSPSYLLGFDEVAAPAAVGLELSALEIQIITRFRALPVGERNMILRSLGLDEENKKDGSIVQGVG